MICFLLYIVIMVDIDIVGIEIRIGLIAMKFCYAFHQGIVVR